MLTVSARKISDELAAKINQPVNWLNSLALTYVFVGYGLGIASL